MGSPRKEKFDYQRAREWLEHLFDEAERDYRNGQPPHVLSHLEEAADVLFASSTQSYREALLGCGLVRLTDRTINIRLPYRNQAANAFSGRTLDERVVNPFLHDHMIPSSKGAYLATFRRNVKFEEDTIRGLRDKKGYRAFLLFLRALEEAQSDEEISCLVRYLLYRFLELREASQIPLAQVAKLNLDQYEQIIEGLLETPSGGLLPVLLTVAMFRTLCRSLNLDWEIQWQGINVADKPAGVGGDITIRRGAQVILAVEVTERPIDRSRVVSTFQTKISSQAIEDYLFLFTKHLPDQDARRAALQYFAQGHDIVFLKVAPWLIHLLGTIGVRGRKQFTLEFLELMKLPSIPAGLKVRWNDLIKTVVGQ